MGSSIHRRGLRTANLYERTISSPITELIVGMAVLGGIIYLAFLLNPQFRGDTLPYIIVVIAEFYLVTQGILSFWTILGGRSNPRNYEYHNAQNSLFGNHAGTITAKQLTKQPVNRARKLELFINNKPVSVAVFIPVYGEPVEEIRETAIAARDMYGKHTTYLLDDGQSDLVKDMARSIGVEYIRRPEHSYAKAGNINHALRQTDEDFFVILDADFIAKRRFIYETLPFFENAHMAMVQTPQYYYNNQGFVSRGAAYMQHIFYSMIMTGKNRFNAAFCVGTCVLFRREAISSIGGIYEKSKSEDIWTSLKLHEGGWQTVYINSVLAMGKTPETLKAYSKQQLRWATGSFEIFFRRNPLLNRKLTIDQRLQYFMTTIFYFNGIACLALLLLPAMQIYLNITPLATDLALWKWALIYSSFYVSQLFLSIYVQGGLKFSTIIISVGSFPIYIKALWNAIRGKDPAWSVTNVKDSTYDSSFNYVRLQLYLFIFLLLTSLAGTWKMWYTQEFSIALAWNIINTLVLGCFIYAAVQENHQLKHAAILQRGRAT